MLSLMDTIVSLVVKVLWKLISLICFRVYLEVNVHKNPTCFSRWSVRQLSVWHILEMLYSAYCMDKYAKSEEESLTKICVSFVEINTDTECACGRAGLMHLIANQAYVGMHVTEGRSLSCTFQLR